MPSIDKIKYGRSSITLILDDGRDADLPLLCLSKYRLETGKELTPGLLEEILRESEMYMCRERAFRCLSMRPHATGEIRRKLEKKDFEKSVIDTTLESLTDSGYLNDHEYAVNHIERRMAVKVVGEHYLRRELYSKGISSDIIELAMIEAGGTHVDFDMLKNAALKKIKSLKNGKNKKTKLISFLRNRGFNAATIGKLIETLHRDNSFD